MAGAALLNPFPLCIPLSPFPTLPYIHLINTTLDDMVYSRLILP